MVGLGLLKSRLAILADHHEGRQENRLQRHHQGQRRPGVFLQDQHPHGKQGRMNPDEVHGSGKRRYPVGKAQLKIRTSYLGLADDGRMVDLPASQ